MRWSVTFDVRVDSGIKLEPALFPLQHPFERLDALYASDSRRNQETPAPKTM
jgi:hypothetical protein